MAGQMTYQVGHSTGQRLYGRVVFTDFHNSNAYNIEKIKLTWNEPICPCTLHMAT